MIQQTILAEALLAKFIRQRQSYGGSSKSMRCYLSRFTRVFSKGNTRRRPDRNTRNYGVGRLV